MVVGHFVAAMVGPSKIKYEGFSNLLVVVSDPAAAVVRYFEAAMVDPSKVKYKGSSNLLVVMSDPAAAVVEYEMEKKKLDVIVLYLVFCINFTGIF